jgi:hypothetical protein
VLPFRGERGRALRALPDISHPPMVRAVPGGTRSPHSGDSSQFAIRTTPSRVRLKLPFCFEATSCQGPFRPMDPRSRTTLPPLPQPAGRPTPTNASRIAPAAGSLRLLRTTNPFFCPYLARARRWTHGAAKPSGDILAACRIGGRSSSLTRTRNWRVRYSGRDRPPVGVGEHRAPPPPARAGAGTGVAAALLGELAPEQFDGLPDGLVDQPPGAGLVQRDGPDTGAALGRPAVQLPRQRDELPGMVSSRASESRSSRSRWPRSSQQIGAVVAQRPSGSLRWPGSRRSPSTGRLDGYATAVVLLQDQSARQLVATAASGIEEEVRQGVRIPLGTASPAGSREAFLATQPLPC